MEWVNQFIAQAVALSWWVEEYYFISCAIFSQVFLFFGAGLRVSGKDFFQLRKMVRIFITITECRSMGIVCALCAHLIGNALSVVAQVLCIMRSGAIEVSKRTGGILLPLEEEQALRRLYHPAREDRKEKGHPSTWKSVSGAKIGILKMDWSCIQYLVLH